MTSVPRAREGCAGRGDVEDELSTIVHQCLPLFPERLDGVDVEEIYSLASVIVLWWQSLYDLSHLLCQLAFASEQL